MRLSATSTSVSSKTVAAGGGGGSSLPAYLTNTDDLIYYIDFHNTNSYSGSGTSITDLSDSGFTTTIEGTEDTHWEYIASDSASSNPAWASKDGHNESYIVATTSSSENFDFGTEDFSIEMWIRPHSGIDGAINAISTFKDVNGDTVDGDPKGYLLIQYAGRHYGIYVPGTTYRGDFGLYMRDYHEGGAGSTTPWATTNWPGYNSGSNVLGDWVHVVLTRSGTSNKLYQNGTEIISATSSTTYNFHSSNNAAVRLFWDTSDDDWGRFSAIRIYKGTALSSSDITAHWNGEKADYGH